MKFFSRYIMRARKWIRYASGSSYQHIEQGRGVQFSPGSLIGYFNDLRHKADWTGPVGSFGVPAVITDTVGEFEFPIVIFQWGLGSWDLWLESGRSDQHYWRQFEAAVQWARANVTSEGGWLCWTGLERPVTSPFSAMAQGQGISLLCRYAAATGERSAIDLAERALAFMLEPGAQALVRDFGDFRSLEEYPGEAFRGVLNGWIFALFGIHDFSLAHSSQAYSAMAAELCAELVVALQQYDCGFWSNYDLAGNIASPFYHNLHIAQLEVLSETFPALSEDINIVSRRFKFYAAGNVNRMRAVIIKVIQKLGQPEIGEMA